MTERHSFASTVRMSARSFGSHGWPCPLGFPLDLGTGRALATGTAWAGLCLSHHHHDRATQDNRAARRTRLPVTLDERPDGSYGASLARAR